MECFDHYILVVILLGYFIVLLTPKDCRKSADCHKGIIHLALMIKIMDFWGKKDKISFK